MKTTKELTKNQLIEMLLNWKHGSQPVSIQYMIYPKINKEGKSKFGDIMKLANVGGLIGYSYTNSVNLQLERENKLANFKSQTIWNGKGQRINNLLIKHVEKGSFYLSYKYQQTFKAFYFDSLLNPLKNEEINDFFYKSASNNQGTDKEIIHREIAIENIKKIKIKKITYLIKG